MWKTKWRIRHGAIESNYCWNKTSAHHDLVQSAVSFHINYRDYMDVGFWVREIAVSEGNTTQMGKWIYGLLSIKGFCNLAASEAEQDSICRIGLHRHACSTQHTANCPCYSFLTFPGASLCLCLTLLNICKHVKTTKSDITLNSQNVWRLTGDVSL